MHLMISGGGEAAEAEAFRSMFEARKTWLKAHAPTSLAASGLDMHVSHPVRGVTRKDGLSSEVLTPRRRAFHDAAKMLRRLRHNASIGPPHPPRLQTDRSIMDATAQHQEVRPAATRPNSSYLVRQRSKLSQPLPAYGLNDVA